MAFAAAVYAILDSTETDSRSGAVSIVFLLLVPALLSAGTALATDRSGERGLGHYLMTPVKLFVVILIVGLVVLREGVICVAMLAPLWLLAGLGGAVIAYSARRRIMERGRLFANGLLLIPLFGVQVEAMFPPQPVAARVIRDLVIDAPPEAIWPHLVAIPDIRSEEGQWNVAQDLLQVPRPTSAVLERRGTSIVRIARWHSSVRFEEYLTTAVPGRSLTWRFAFPDESVRNRTDRHVAPDGAHLRVLTGAYRLDRLANNHTRLTLETHYVLQTPLAAYANWWGDLLLGGIQENVLAIVKARAES